MAYELKLPDLGEGLSEGEIARWLVSEGQDVAEDDPLVEVQTDKTTVEIPSPASGTVVRILVEEGKVVPVGTVLVVIGSEPDGDQPRAEPTPAKAADVSSDRIARWLVSEGQDVAEDDPLVEVQTDKTTVEIPSPASGTVVRILVEEGKVVPVGTVLVVIGSEPDGDQPRAEPTPAKAADVSSTDTAGVRPRQVKGGRVRATPLVRRIAQELSVDLDSLEGSGPQGRITEADVRAAAQGGPGPAGVRPRHVEEGRREPLRGVRRLIAEHMVRAHREVPPVTWVEECDFTNVDLKLLVPTFVKSHS